MIRSATTADIPQMIALFRRHHTEMGCDWSIDVDRLENTFRQAIASPEQWLCLTGDGCLLLATCFDNPLGAGRLAMEFCFCAPPRKLDELMDRYEAWAREKGCRKSSLSFIKRFAAFTRLFRRRGYFPDEMTMSKVL
jgi:hypothetical protein